MISTAVDYSYHFDVRSFDVENCYYTLSSADLERAAWRHNWIDLGNVLWERLF